MSMMEPGGESKNIALINGKKVLFNLQDESMITGDFIKNFKYLGTGTHYSCNGATGSGTLNSKRKMHFWRRKW